MPSEKCYFWHGCFRVSALKSFFCARPKKNFGQNNFWFPIFGCIISIVCTSKCTMYWLVTKHVRINNICFGQIFPVSKTSVNDLFFCTSKFSIKRLMTSKNQPCLFQPNMFGLHNFSSSLILFTLPKLACKGRLQNKQESTVFSLMSNLAHCVLFLWSKSKVFID